MASLSRLPIPAADIIEPAPGVRCRAAIVMQRRSTERGGIEIVLRDWRHGADLFRSTDPGAVGQWLHEHGFEYVGGTGVWVRV